MNRFRHPFVILFLTVCLAASAAAQARDADCSPQCRVCLAQLAGGCCFQDSGPDLQGHGSEHGTSNPPDHKQSCERLCPAAATSAADTGISPPGHDRSTAIATGIGPIQAVLPATSFHERLPVHGSPPLSQRRFIRFCALLM